MKKLLKILLIFMICHDAVGEDLVLDSVYKKAFTIITETNNCIQDFYCSGPINFFVSTQILYLKKVSNIDTNMRSFYNDEKLYSNSKVFYVLETMNELNTITDSIFLIQQGAFT